MKLTRWYVITPEYGVVVPVTDEGQGPTEYGCDVIEIEAGPQDERLFTEAETWRGGSPELAGDA